MAEHSRNRLRRVDVALCSTAIRTHETLRLLERSLPPSCKTALDDAFYLADWRVLLSALHGLDDRCNVALLVGHDPGLSKLARCLCPERGSPKALRRIRKGLKPGSLAAINLPIDHWRDLSPGVGRLRAVIKPKDLR